MSKILVIGATGAIGFQIVKQLVEEGCAVDILVRNLDAAKTLFREMSGINYIVGDIEKAASVHEAVLGKETVFHAAGLPEQWLPDVDAFRRVNVEGTRNVIAACKEGHTKRLVYTSTIDVFLWTPGQPFDEAIIQDTPCHTAYERSKQEADKLVTAAQADGLDVVFLHPSGVYGAGVGSSAGVNQIFADIKEGKMPVLLPGGLPLVTAEDAARGHLAAWRHAASGERFILSEGYYGFAEILATIAKVTEVKKTSLPTIPFWLATLVAILGEFWANLVGKPPLLARGQLIFVRSQPIPDASFAMERLNWRPDPLEQGLRKLFAQPTAWQ